MDCSVPSVAALLAACQGCDAILTAISETWEDYEETPRDYLREEWHDCYIQMHLHSHMYIHSHMDSA